MILRNKLARMSALLVLGLLPGAIAQETTAGLQGTVKDSSGGAIANATVEVASPALIGVKKATTDAAGYYRFANLPPGTYTVTFSASGFRTYKEPDVELLVGHLPTLNATMQVGQVTETVEVASQAALIDPTQSRVQTNISATNLMDLPTQSLSFQSVIQFAPGARYEPLQSSNGSANNGFQINGASNSENAYLVEGQETASMSSGASNANVPMDFIQEVQVKTNGFEAENGGALGGVVNVILKSGGNEVHGSVFSYYRADPFDANPNPNLIRNPQFPTNLGGPRLDQPLEYYYPKKDHYRIADPGFTLGGPIVKDRLWFFLAANPDFNQVRRTVNFTYPGASGPRVFNDNNYTYYALARVDYLATQKIRLHGSWQYNYARGTGTSLPSADDIHGQFNSSSTQNPDNFNGGIGYVQPNVLYNAGADITLTPTVVATTRFGYWAYDGTPESRGLPSGIRYVYTDTNYNYSTGIPGLPTTKALDGTPLPAQFQQAAGYSNIGANSATVYDWWRRWTFNQDLAFFRNWHGTHNFKVGYGFMHGTADELAGAYNTADVYVAYNDPYIPQSQIGIANCKAIVAQNIAKYGVAGGNTDGTACQGLWGTVNVRDLISASGKVGGWNHSFYVQDAWTISHRLTLNLGLRLDKESLPSYNSLPGFNGISFGWGDKLAPRLGAAYDVLGNGKVKVFASFGYFFDIMKYNLPLGSFGGAYWHDCVYALDSADYTGIIPQRDSQGHYCPVGTGGNTPAVGQMPNMRFIENYDYREPANDPNQIGSLGKTGLVDPNLKPMKEHVLTIGGAWEIGHNLVFEPTYTRSRLDRTIEDAGVITPNGEVYYIVNPGFGVNAQVPSCPACPPNPKAIRDYDGIEFRLTKRFSDQWFGVFSYTYSRLYGNYTGLTATDVSDSIGRNGANTDRAFDEPFMSYDANGHVITANGPLPTDRPNTFKINGYYTPKLKWFNPTIGLFEQIYSGTPLSTYMSVWGAPVFVDGRGEWLPVTRDSSTGNWVAGTPTAARTPMFTQSDISIFEDFHVSKTNERLIARIGGDCLNCFNQHAVTVINSNLLRTGSINPYQCGTAGVSCTTVTDQNAGFNYAAVLGGYNFIGLANSQGRTLSSLYGAPQAWQNPRTLRFQVRFTF